MQDQPIAPQQDVGIVQEQPNGVNNMAPTQDPKQKQSKKRAKWFLPAIIAASVAVVAGGGSFAYFAVYQQSPENLWKSGLNNTGQGFKRYVEKDTSAIVGSNIEGSFKVTSPTSADGTIKGSSDSKSAQFTAESSIAGVKNNLELRTITKDENANPDVYIKLGGLTTLSSFLDMYSPGLGDVLKTADNKWYVIDHTLLDEATKNMGGDISKLPSNKQLQDELIDVAKKMASVLDDSLFSTEESKAVVAVKETLQKEDFKGRKAQHYKVQVQKEQFKTMIKNLRETVRDTELEKLVLDTAQQQLGDTQADMPTVDSLLNDIEKLNFDKAVADVWVDTGLKYVRNVRIEQVDNEAGSTSTIDFMLDYTGGDSYPLSININVKEKESEYSLLLGMTINQKTDDIKLTLAMKGGDSVTPIDLTAELTMQPNESAVKVEVPEGAANILDLVGSVMQSLQNLQAQFGGVFGGTDALTNETSVNCTEQLQQFAQSGGTSSIDPSCMSMDDSEI